MFNELKELLLTEIGDNIKKKESLLSKQLEMDANKRTLEELEKEFRDLSRIKKLFFRKKVRELSNKIDELRNTLSWNHNPIIPQKTIQEIEKLEKEKDYLLNAANVKELPYSFEEIIDICNNNNINISFSPLDLEHYGVTLTQDLHRLISSPSDNFQIDELRDLVLIHKTNLAPKNGIINTNKNGKKSFSAVEKGKEFNYDDQRDTVHFCVNSEVVPNDGGGEYWDLCKYAILLPFADAPIERTGSRVNAADYWFNGDIALSENSIIICPEEEKAKIKNQNPAIIVIGYLGANAFNHTNSLIRLTGKQYIPSGTDGFLNPHIQESFKSLMDRIKNERGLTFELARHSDSEEFIKEKAKSNLAYLLEYLNTISPEQIFELAKSKEQLADVSLGEIPRTELIEMCKSLERELSPYLFEMVENNDISSYFHSQLRDTLLRSDPSIDASNLDLSDVRSIIDERVSLFKNVSNIEIYQAEKGRLNKWITGLKRIAISLQDNHQRMNDSEFGVYSIDELETLERDIKELENKATQLERAFDLINTPEGEINVEHFLNCVSDIKEIEKSFTGTVPDQNLLLFDIYFTAKAKEPLILNSITDDKSLSY